MSTPSQFHVREAIADDLEYFTHWLPWSLGVPPARMGVAMDANTGKIAGVAALRVQESGVGIFQLYVDPTHRRRGCGTTLLGAIGLAARQAGMSALKTGVACEPEPVDGVVAFLQAQGFVLSEDILRYRADLASALAVLEPLYRRFERERNKPHAARIVSSDQVDRNALADFAVRHVGGFREAIAERLAGQGWAYAPAMSRVAVLDGNIVGAMLASPTDDALFIETRAVESAHRGSWINLGLMYLGTESAHRLGVTALEFEGAADDRDTTKLARRFAASQVGRRQTWLVGLAEIPVEPNPRSNNFGSEYTPSFPELLNTLGCSLVLTTGSLGKLVVLRTVDDQLNTHFLDLPNPMGLAYDGNRLAIATAEGIREFREDTATFRSQDQACEIDAYFRPSRTYPTLDGPPRELAYARPPLPVGGKGEACESELWLVDTRYPCLRAFDSKSGFVPRWQPPFISEHAAEDRCHLNGLALVEGEPRYVTVVAESDEPAGWRSRWRYGGGVLDVRTGQFVCRGLSLPHAPRWDGRRLWLLNSAEHALGVIDPNRGIYQEVTRLPGFPMGLAIAGDFAFVALCTAPAAPFADLGIDRFSATEAFSGVSVVDLRSAAIVAFLRFADGVPEVLGIHPLLGKRFPEFSAAANPLPTGQAQECVL